MFPMKLQLNREFATRHLGVAALMLALSLWFAYDGFIAYPATSGHDLYVKIEKSEPPAGFDLEAFKTQKIQTQYGFTLFTLLVSGIIAAGVLRNHRRTLEWDDERMTGTLTQNKPLAFAEIKTVDTRRWDNKGILVLHAQDGRRVTLDAWHHTGVEELAKKLLPGEQAPTAPTPTP